MQLSINYLARADCEKLLSSNQTSQKMFGCYENDPCLSNFNFPNDSAIVAKPYACRLQLRSRHISCSYRNSLEAPQWVTPADSGCKKKCSVRRRSKLLDQHYLTKFVITVLQATTLRQLRLHSQQSVHAPLSSTIYGPLCSSKLWQ